MSGGVADCLIVRLTPKFSCKHTTTIAAKPHPKSAWQLQRVLASGATGLKMIVWADRLSYLPHYLTFIV